MSRANTAELVGACAVVRRTRPRLMLSDKTFRLIFRPRSVICHHYAEHLLKSPALRDQIVRAATGSSPTMKNISKAKVLSLRVPRHSAEEQGRIRQYLDAIEQRIQALREEQRAAAAGLDALMPSALDCAFRGEL